MRATGLVLLVAVSLVAGYALRGYLAPSDPPVSAARSYRPPPVSPPGSPDKTASAEVQSVPVVQPTPEFADLTRQASVFDTLNLAYQLAAEADTAALERYTLEALSYEEPLYKLYVADVFLMRLNAIDLNAALDLLEGLPDSENRRQLLTSMVTIWAMRDPEAAGAYADSISDPRLRYTVAYAFARETTLPAELREMDGAFAMSADGVVSNSAFGVMQTGDRQLFNKALRELRQEPEKTMDKLIALEDSANKAMLLQSALGRLAQFNPELALSYVEQYPGQFQHGESIVIGTLAQTSSSPETRALVEDYAQRSGDTGPLGQMLSQWMQRDSEAALAYYAGMPEQFQKSVATQVGINYIQKDPEAGLDWIIEQTGDVSMVGLAIRIGGQPMVQKAEAMLDQMSDDNQRQQLLWALASDKASGDPAAAIDWLAQYQGEPGYEAAYGNVLSDWANRDPVAVAGVLQGGPELETPGIYTTLGYVWGQRDPEAALAWGDSLTDPDRQANYLASVATAVGQYDEERAREIYFDMPDGDARNRLGAELAVRRAGNDMAAIREAMEELGMSDDVIESYQTVWGGRMRGL